MAEFWDKEPTKILELALRDRRKIEDEHYEFKFSIKKQKINMHQCEFIDKSGEIFNSNPKELQNITSNDKNEAKNKLAEAVRSLFVKWSVPLLHQFFYTNFLHQFLH